MTIAHRIGGIWCMVYIRTLCAIPLDNELSDDIHSILYHDQFHGTVCPD